MRFAILVIPIAVEAPGAVKLLFQKLLQGFDVFASRPGIRLFVYGTLKKGFRNHDRFCSNAISIEPATTWGRLYQLPAGFPALEVPTISILATGTADPLADTRTQNETKIPQSALKLFSNNPHSAINNQQSSDWDLVHGELMTFTNPGFDLPPIDRLEAFNPNGRCVYKRVLMAVETENQIRPVWLYHYNIGHNAERIASGRWYLSK